MNINPLSLVLLLHILAMAGTIGALLVIQFALPVGTRDSASVARRCSHLLNSLVSLGFLAGLSAFVIKFSAFKAAGTELSSAYHALIGTKFLLLVAVGACLGMASALLRKGRSGAAHSLRTAALVLLVVAAFMGSMLGS